MLKIEDQNLNSSQRTDMFKLLLLTAFCFLWGCSPLKSSPDQEHQNELTLHQMKTTIDDLSHDVRCFKTDMEILGEKINHAENHKEIQRLSQKQKNIEDLLESLSGRLKGLQSQQAQLASNFEKLSSFSEDTTLSLHQFKQKISNLKKSQKELNLALNQVMQLKYSIKELASLSNDKVYKVLPGDSLEKIARTYDTTVDKLKAENNLTNDLIVVGQELILP